MKNLEKEKLQTLLEIIGSDPSQRIVHFTDGGKTFIDTLFDYCFSKEYLYQINCTDSTSFENISEKFKESTIAKVRKLPLERKSYMMQGKQYDYLFVTSSITEELRDVFLKRTYKIILNAGNIVVLIPKNDYTQRYNWIALLEENYYVATNTIDDLFEHYDVIISKKMHGWGNT
jgi:hypothetical protein